MKTIKGMSESDYNAIVEGTKKLKKADIVRLAETIRVKPEYRKLTGEEVKEFATLYLSKYHSALSLHDLIVYYKKLSNDRA